MLRKIQKEKEEGLQKLSKQLVLIQFCTKQDYMFLVYILQNKKIDVVQIGFTEDLIATHKQLEKKFKTKLVLVGKEKYKSKKDAMIRVKQLRNKIR